MTQLTKLPAENNNKLSHMPVSTTTMNVPVPDLLASLTSNDDSNPEKISIGQFSNSISSSVKSNLSKFSSQNVKLQQSSHGLNFGLQGVLSNGVASSIQQNARTKLNNSAGKLSLISNPDSSISIGNGIVTPNTSSGDGKSPKSSVNHLVQKQNNAAVLHSMLIDESSVELPYITPIMPSVAQTIEATLNGTGSRPNSSQHLLLSTATNQNSNTVIVAASDTSTLGLSQSGRLSQLQHLTSLASHPLVKSPSPRKPENLVDLNDSKRYPTYVGLTCGQIEQAKKKGNFLCPSVPASRMKGKNSTLSSTPYLYHRKNRVNLIGKSLHIKPLWSGPHRLTTKNLRKNINKNFDFTSSCSRANFENEFLDYMQDSSSAARLQNQIKKRRQKEKYLKQISSTRRAAVVASRRSYGKGSR